MAIDGESFRIADFAINEVGCEPRVMRTEEAYVDALHAAETIYRADDRLVLKGPRASLRFIYVPPERDATLTGTRWEFDGTIEGSGPDALVSFARAGYLFLHKDGLLRGFTGCRKFSAAWRQHGDRIATSSFDVMGLCRDRDARSQDNQVVKVLRDEFSFDITGSRLEVFQPTQDLGLLYRAE